jgi:hypothetical protein
MIRPVQVVAPPPSPSAAAAEEIAQNRLPARRMQSVPLEFVHFKQICHIEPESKSSLAYYYYYYYYVDFFSDDTHIAAAVVAFLALVEADEALR